MAESAKGKTYSKTGQTFEETFRGKTKGTAEYKEALEALAKEYARLNDLSDTQRQWLEDYLNKLDNISDAWEKINDYVEDFTGNFDEFSKDLGDVRNLFSNILKDLQPAKRQAVEHINLLKNFRDLAGEIQRATEVQNGTSEASLNSLNRRVQKQKELYEWAVKTVVEGGGYKDRAAALSGEAAKVEELEAEKAGLDRKIRRLQEKLKDTTNLNSLQRWNAKAELDEALKAQKDFNKVKAAELDLHRSNVELLQDEARAGVERTAEASEELVQERRRLGRQTPGLNLAARIAEKFGVTGARQELEDYYQQRMRASRSEGAEPSTASLLGGWAKDAITLSGVLAALGLTVKSIVAAFKDVSSEAAKLKQNIGTWQFSAAAANTEFASSVQWLQTANELAQQFGQDPTSFISPEGIARLAEAKNLLGLSAEQAGNLGIRAKIAGQNTDNYSEALVQGINHGNAMNRSAVAHGIALKEALSTSDNLVLSLGNSGERLGRAVVAAKNLGMTLKDVDNIAGQLLNFESSIESEMQAQLLTGQQMNLSRARALALQNDLEGVAKELTRQHMDAAKFGNLNRIQQESFAKALGMSREQLGRMLVTQQGISKLTDAQVKAATGMTREQLEAMGITERWKVATEKLAQAFTPVLEAVMPAIETISKAVAWIAGGIGKIFSGISGGIGPVITGLLALTGVVLVARGAFRLLGLAGRSVFTGIGAGIRGLVTAITPLASTGVGWAAVGMVAALAAAAAALGWGIGQATKGLAVLVSSFKELDAENILMIGPALVSMAAGLASFAVIPGVLIGAGKLAIATKALKTLDSGRIQEASSRASNVRSAAESSLESRETATNAVLGRVEKLLSSIDAKVSPNYDVYLDVDKVGHTLARYSTNG